ncbi:alkene reductase [Nocardioides sp. cx-173]|uniref:alkene reductase n=1 Tax=Nocardioides sp. cx-173 TaxID=2898796 RepID=UPI001E2F77EA|nr:alkene reductase [Nocardioides sp. cx-173]MCD4527446.1 alkene reductase [Nocardioides sp. cx-173]UGB40992.1 alkene reductase [Nocardioides sp. cx-173]
MSTAFTPLTVGAVEAKNRIAMSPMTRSRAYGEGFSPTPLMAEYYAQRAGAGLIVTEGIQPSAIGQGYPNTPGLHSHAQVAGWRRVTDAVHERGGVIFAQLMHTGRIGHPSNYAEPVTPVGASPVKAAGQIFTAEGPQDHVVPEPLTGEQVRETIADFARAAENAVEAGFDGVELHGANGYLLHQFLSTNANRRDDEWGGPPERRVRLMVEATRAVADAIGAGRTALRISPANPLGDLVEDDYEATYPLVVDALNGLGLAYLHLLETEAPELTPVLRAAWDGVLMLNPATPGSHTGPEQLALIDEGAADLVSFGQLFIANPDLPERLASGAPLAQPDLSKAYGGDERGYTDYPALSRIR